MYVLTSHKTIWLWGFIFLFGQWNLSPWMAAQMLPPESKFAARDLSRSTPLTSRCSSFYISTPAKMYKMQNNSECGVPKSCIYFFRKYTHRLFGSNFNMTQHTRNNQLCVCPNHKQIIAFFHSIGRRKCFFFSSGTGSNYSNWLDCKSEWGDRRTQPLLLWDLLLVGAAEEIRKIRSSCSKQHF